MSMPKVTVDQARAAQKPLHQQIAKAFANAADPIVTGYIGLTKVSADDYGLKVNLKRFPTAQEKALLPDVFQGVAVEYAVDDDIRAAGKGCDDKDHVCSCPKGPK